MFEVICDTNFLIHLSTRRIKNIDSANSEIGDFQYVVPLVVLSELQRLSTVPDKEQDANKTLEFVRNLNPSLRRQVLIFFVLYQFHL